MFGCIERIWLSFKRRSLEKKIEAAYKVYEEALKVFEERRDEESLMNVKQAKNKYEELLAQQK